jgi:hypothetical protein
MGTVNTPEKGRARDADKGPYCWRAAGRQTGGTEAAVLNILFSYFDCGKLEPD